jgi:hypothetical protein
MTKTRTHYLTNKDLLREIHNSKMTYCWIQDEEFKHYDLIILSFDEINEDTIFTAKQNRAKRCADFAVDIDSIKDEELVFRVMTFEHIPEEQRKNKPKTEADHHSKCNFPPFKHYAKRNNNWEEVARSHWEGGRDNGYFSVDHGKTTPELARAYIKLCERYSMRSNWRGYTYVDEMRGQALLQLSQIGLQFNEAKSENPFAYYTAAINNSFTRVLNLEKRSQNIRDDLLEEGGLNPSSTRTFNAEWESQQELIKKEAEAQKSGE